MKRLISLLGGSVFFVLLHAAMASGDTKEQAIKKERMRYAGTWQVESVEVDGNKLSDDQAKAFKVINELDGKWRIEQDGKVVARGTSEIDPTQKLKTVDLVQTEGEGKGQTILGIYEFSGDTRKVCLAQAGNDRPTEFAASAGSKQILAILKKVKK